MFTDTLHKLIDQYGYLLFYLTLALGPFGLPVPNEVTAMTGGVTAAAGTLNPWGVFVFIIGGLLTSVSLSFAAGNYIGSKVIRRLKKKSKYRRHIRRAEKILNKYGNAAYALSCFVPVVRYAVPVLAGASRTKFKRFAVYSYSGVAVWTLVYFGLGLGFGQELAAFVAGLNPYVLAGVAAALAGGYFTYRLLRKSKTAEPPVLAPAPAPVPGEKVRP